MKDIKTKSTLLASAFLITILCAGCGSSSDQAEIDKLPKDPAATRTPPTGGGSVGGENAEVMKHDERPAGQ